MNITAIIPVKNGSEFISKSIYSIIKNMRHSDEVIFIDDNSDDNSQKILRSLTKNYLNVQILQNPGAGIVDALNFGILKAKNDWIARFDIDDLYLTERVEFQREFICAEVAAIFCDYNFIDKKNRFLGQVLSPVFSQANVWSLIRCQRTPHPGVLFSKIIFLKAGGYIKKDFPVEDMALWWRMSKYGKLVSVPKTLLQYRLHNNSTSAVNRLVVNQKRSEILREYFYLPKSKDQLSFKSQYNSYRLISAANERQLLAILDYFAFLNYSNLRVKAAMHLLYYVPKIVFSPNKLQILFRLLKEKRQRKKYRLNYRKFK